MVIDSHFDAEGAVVLGGVAMGNRAPTSTTAAIAASAAVDMAVDTADGPADSARGTVAVAMGDIASTLAATATAASTAADMTIDTVVDMDAGVAATAVAAVAVGPGIRLVGSSPWNRMVVRLLVSPFLLSPLATRSVVNRALPPPPLT